MPRTTPAVAALCVSLAGACLSTLSAAGRDATADLSLRDLSGKRMRLRDLRGQNVVLNFWATWCGPCNDELPMLVEAEKQYRGRGITFVGASLDEPKTRDRIPEFVQKYRIPFAVWVGATVDDLDRFGLKEAVPGTVFLDQDGRIVARVSGQIRKPELMERIEWLVGDRKGAAPEAFVVHLDGK